MARTVTLTTLQTRVLQRAHMPVASSNGIVSSGELTDDINEGIAELYSLIAAKDGGSFYQESVSFQTLAGIDTYGIGPGQPIAITDFLAPKGLDVSFGANIVNTARPFMWNERNRFKYLDPGWTYVQNVYYALTGKSSSPASAALDSIKFIPSPPGAYSCTLFYIPTPPVLVSGTDTFDGILGFEEYAVLSAAMKLLIKQEQFEHATVLASERARQEDRINSLMRRDSEEPDRVRDVTNLDQYPPLRANW